MKYINYRIATDVEPYEVLSINEAGTRATVRAMSCERTNAEDDVVSPGGFAAHFDHPKGQRWECKPNPDATSRKMSLRNDGRWQFVGESTCRGAGLKGVLADEPRKFHDYNF